ncbi:MAG: CBS domain-containing protein [Spirochaetes bacterium]|nr:CBS domain-containing protein [Spirochaetota bacterium]
MTPEIHTVGPEAKMRDVQEIMRAKYITGVPVVDGKRLLGLVSVDDIIRALDEGYVDDSVVSRMTRNLIVLEDDMPLSFGISYVEKYQFGRFPVLNREKELVGIITSRDIILALLVELDHEVSRLEERVPDIGGAHRRGEATREFNIRNYDFENAGKASTELRKLLKQQGVDRKLIRRAAVAAYELEMNIVVHSQGGKLSFSVHDDEVEILAADRGPGIEDVEQALTEGYSTATEWVRSLGFGAGMGLPNAQRVCDEFDIESSESGTTVRARIRFPEEGAET